MTMDSSYAAAYGKYRKVRNAAWHFLLDYHVTQLPLPLRPLLYQVKVRLCDFASNAALIQQRGLGKLLETEAFSVMDPHNKMVIFYSNSLARQELRYTVAHELGHIVLGHVGRELPQGKLLSPSDERQERAADRFAIRILAPACFLWAKNAYTAEEIAVLCGIPLKQAKSRARRMILLRERGAWLQSPLEQEVYRQFGLPEVPQELKESL